MHYVFSQSVRLSLRSSVTGHKNHEHMRRKQTLNDTVSDLNRPLSYNMLFFILKTFCGCQLLSWCPTIQKNFNKDRCYL